MAEEADQTILLVPRFHEAWKVIIRDVTGTRSKEIQRAPAALHVPVSLGPDEKPGSARRARTATSLALVLMGVP